MTSATLDEISAAFPSSGHRRDLQFALSPSAPELSLQNTELDEFDWTVPLATLFRLSADHKGATQVPVGWLNLTVRSRNVIDKMPIKTVTDLLALTIADLMIARNMGRRSVVNVLDSTSQFLRQIGLETYAAYEVGASASPEPDLSPMVSSARMAMGRTGQAFEFRGNPPDSWRDEIKNLRSDATVFDLLPFGTDHAALAHANIGSLQLPTRAMSAFDGIGVRSVADLQSLTVSRLMECWGVGFGTLWDLLCRLHEATGRAGYASNDIDLVQSVAGQTAYTVSAQAMNADLTLAVSTVKSEASLAMFDWIASSLSRSTKSTLMHLQVCDLTTLAAICDQRKSDLAKPVALLRANVVNAIRAAGLSGATATRAELASHFWRIVRCSQPPDFVSDPPLTGTVGLRIVDILSSKPQHLRSLLLRLQGSTLDEIAHKIGRTRERARQLSVKAVEILMSHPGFGEWSLRAILDTLNRHAGMIDVYDLEEALLGCGKARGSRTSILVRHLAKTAEFQRAGIQLTGSTLQILGASLDVVHLVARIVVDLSRRVADDEPGLGLYSAPVSAVLPELSAAVNAELGIESGEVEVSIGTLRDAISAVSELIRLDGDRIFSTPYWTLRRGRKIQRVEAVLLAAGRPLHRTEIVAEIDRWTNPSDRIDVRGPLDRSQNIILWGRGTYVHRQCVHLPHALLTEISDGIAAKLAKGLPYISVAGVFDQFHTACTDGGIPNRAALYGALGEARDARFTTEEYPYIRRRDDASERPPVNMVIQQFVRSEGGPVSRKTIFRYCTADLGVDQRLVPIYLSNAPNVLLGSSFVIHADYVNVDRSTCYELQMECEALLKHDVQFSVTKLITMRPVLCARLGIQDKKLLHSFIIHSSDGKLTGTFPHVGVSDNAAAIRSGRQTVLDYVRDCNGPCSFSELRQSLIQDRGLNPWTVFGAVGRDRLVRYTTSSIVHLDAIDWNDEKQESLCQVALKHFDDTIARGELCGSISGLVEWYDDRLPNVDPLVWTKQFTSDILQRATCVHFIGNAMDAYVAAGNSLRIRTLDDYVRTYLERCCSGACHLDELEEKLLVDRVILKRLTQQMLGENSAVVISEQDVMLRRLIHAR